VTVVEALVVRMCGRLLKGLVEVKDALDMFASAGKLFNSWFDEVVGQRLLDPSSMYALQAVLLLAANQGLVARGCNVMSTSAVNLHKQLLLHHQFPTAVQKGSATRKAALVCAVTCLHLGGPDCCTPTFLVTYLSCYSGSLHDEDRLLRSALMMLEANNISPKMLDYAWGAATQGKAAASTIINSSGSGAFGWLWTFSGIYVCTHTHTHTHTHICIYIYTYIHTYVCNNTSFKTLYILHIYVCICVHIYIHTYVIIHHLKHYIFYIFQHFLKSSSSQVQSCILLIL